MHCSRLDIILLPIPFTDLSSSKIRPAIVIGHGSFSGDLFVVPITSQLHQADFNIIHWQQAGLNVPSGIKGQLATVEDRLVRKITGRLQPNDALSLENHLRQWLGL